MDQNTTLGSLLMVVGASDIALARLLGDKLKLTDGARTVLTLGGIALLAFGGLVAARVIRII